MRGPSHRWSSPMSLAVPLSLIGESATPNLRTQYQIHNPISYRSRSDNQKVTETSIPAADTETVFVPIRSQRERTLCPAIFIGLVSGKRTISCGTVQTEIPSSADPFHDIRVSL